MTIRRIGTNQVKIAVKDVKRQDRTRTVVLYFCCYCSTVSTYYCGTVSTSSILCFFFLFELLLCSASSSFGRDPHFQMLAVMVLSQHRVSTSKTVSPRIPVGARCTGHIRMMCSAVCSAAPHSQFDVP